MWECTEPNLCEQHGVLPRRVWATVSDVTVDGDCIYLTGMLGLRSAHWEGRHAVGPWQVDGL